MAHENSVQKQTTSDVAYEARLLNSIPVALLVQEVGRRLLISGSLLEVEENVFSTCGEPLGMRGDRLLRARDAKVPLVEVTTFPKARPSDAMPVYSVLRSSGEEQHDDFWGNHIPFESVDLVVPDVDIVYLNGSRPSKVAALLSTGRYFDYDSGRGKDIRGYDRSPSMHVSCSYERDYDSPLSGRTGMIAALGRALEDFEIASSRDGVVIIEGEAADVVPPGQRAS
jgi:hypothetical protein